MSLTGVARRILGAVSPGRDGGYEALREALEDRFQPANQGAMYKAMLKSKERGPGECLQAHAEEIERYTQLAYPKADLASINLMAKDRFVDSLPDTQLQYWILQSHPDTLRDAVQCGLEAEACMRPLQQSQKARVAGSTMAEELATLRQEIRKQGEESKKGREEAAASRKRPDTRPPNRGAGRSAEGKLLCYYCNEEGHFKRECPRFEADLKQQGGTSARTTVAPTSGN